jgi:hypothetical protein
MRYLSALLIAPALLAQAPAPVPDPVLTFDKVHHDFGKISAEKKVSVKFKVTNTGKSILNITNINPSCGCTSTMLGKWSLVAGESSELEASFDPKGNRGQVRKSIQVTSNDPKNPVATLTMEADVVQDIMPSTTSVFFTDVPRSTPRKAVVRLSSGGAQPVQVTEVKVPGAPYLTSSFHPEGADVLVELTFDGRKVPSGQVRGVEAVTIRTTNANQPTLSLSAQWELKAFVNLKPDRVTWVDVAGKEYRSTLNLSQAEGKPFTLTGVKSSNPLIKVEGLTRKSAVAHDVTVILAAGTKAGSLSEHLTFTTDLAEQPEVEVRVAAILR